MNIYLFVAGILCFLLGIVHSILGEFLIFKDKRNKGSLVPSKESKGLRGRHMRILWATWHLASLFGWCIGMMLIKTSLMKENSNSDILDFMLQSMSGTMILSSLLVLVGTKGRHPGWVVLLLIGVLLILGS